MRGLADFYQRFFGCTASQKSSRNDRQYFAIFTDGHNRQLPRLTGGPFRNKTYAAEFTEKAMKMATKPLKQAVIAPSMFALLYPLDGEVKGYSRNNSSALPYQLKRTFAEDDPQGIRWAWPPLTA